MDDTPAIVIKNVHKTFKGKVHALRGVSMTVDRGQIFGLLGPNGAGKSTLVKVLMTVVRPTRIDGTMLGKPIGHVGTLRHVGYLPEHHRFPKYLTADQLLHYYGGLEGMPRRDRTARIGLLLERTGMSAWRHKRIGGFSKGMQQRVGLAQALLHDPELLLLDEPTDGVDPVGRREIRELLVELRNEGRTILVNSHILAELEPICQQVAILVKGTLAREGTVADLTADRSRWEVECTGTTPDWLDTIDNATAQPRGSLLCITLPGDGVDDVQQVLDRARADGRTVHRVQRVGESLEDLFIRSLEESSEANAAVPGAIDAGKAGT
jgi:ABC-2 type transport system ATP-binding protein